MQETLSKQALLSISNIIAMMNTTDTLQQFFAHIQQTLNSITYAENFYLALVNTRSIINRDLSFKQYCFYSSQRFIDDELRHALLQLYISCPPVHRFQLVTMH